MHTITSWLALALVVLQPSLACAGPKVPKIWQEPNTGMAFVELPKGCFQMGTSAKAMDKVNDPLWQFRASLAADEMPRHEVCVDAFWIGQTEVRASDWAKVMGVNQPSGNETAPAGSVSFEAAQEFAGRLTALSAGRHHFRLPTEAEWEYACLAGEKKSTLPLDENRVDAAWYSVPEHRVVQPSAVGQLKPNAWGLYDMLGNVWEWVEDGYQPAAYARHALYNPLQKEALNGERVIRGASHRSDYIQVRCANRSSYPAGESLGQIGLRLVRKP